ncbi:MAG: nuclear transport factor 2 family protein [Bacteroidota bacterium]|nr:nuclear transport factor 2 family protein [Bacteroidota bacterium]
MTTEKEQSLNSAYETFVRLVISDGAIDQLDDVATHNTMGYGTTIDEVIHDLTGLKNLARLQREQTSDENFHYNSTPVFRKVMNHDKSAVFVDEVELIFVFDGNPMSFQIRLSVIMELVDGKWKAVHFHASKPEYDSGGSDPWHKEEWKQKMKRFSVWLMRKLLTWQGKTVSWKLKLPWSGLEQLP